MHVVRVRRPALLLGAVLATAVALPARAEPPRAGEGPWNHDLESHVSADGRRFERVGTAIERAGVASLARRADGALLAVFQWFPTERPEAFDRIARSLSEDGGRTWSPPQPIALTGLPAGYQRAFDPTLVTLPGGGWRLYFTSGPAPERGGPGVRRILSARSEDARTFAVEPGERFAVEGAETYDCAVARLGDRWHLLTPGPGPGRALHAVSDDGLAFERAADIALEGSGPWIGNLLAVDGGLRFFGSGREGWSARSANGTTWTLEDGVSFRGGDPAVIALEGGRWLMWATGGSRGTPEPRRGGGEARTPGAEPGAPTAPGRALGGPTLTCNEQYVFVLRGDELLQFDAVGLTLLKRVRLPAPESQAPQPR